MMKTSTVEGFDEFRPFTIAISFHTKSEAKRWREMMGMNLSIPEMMDLPTGEQEILTNEMSMVQREIIKNI